jgi:succinoglycan biosynthesis protein ExoV
VKLYYYKDPIGNFGDDLNPWLWPQLFPKSIEHCFDNDTLFLGIGSVLNHKIPEHPNKKIVFSSGFGYGTLPSITDSWRFICVRGPLTAKLLHLPESTAICDGALLVRELIGPAQTIEYEVSFMPHHLTAKYDDWRSICESLGYNYIDPASPVDYVIDSIRKSGVVISESLHGAIIADAFRIPWIPVRTRPRIAEFKWQDWSRSVGLEHHFEWLSPAWIANIDSRLKRIVRPISISLAKVKLQRLVCSGRRRLSNEMVFNSVYMRLLESFNSVVEESSRCGA